MWQATDVRWAMGGSNRRCQQLALPGDAPATIMQPKLRLIGSNSRTFAVDPHPVQRAFAEQ